MRLNSKGHSANAEKFYPSFFENISIADNRSHLERILQKRILYQVQQNRFNLTG